MYKFDVSITNSTLFAVIGCGFFLSLSYMIYILNNFITNQLQYVSKEHFFVVLGLISENIGVAGKKYFSLVFSLFSFILFANLIGMVPYSFTITSHLILTFGCALLFFLGINYIGIAKHKQHFLSLFLPSGSTVFLAIILIPIELISYLFRVVSLPVRLFANMMAGHTLLKVIAGFAWTMMTANAVIFFFHYLPTLLLIILMGLELGVGIIQAYVFSILVCMYLNDALHLH